jgi:hypothetical protein
MKVTATDQGLMIPKEWLDGVQEFEIRKENDRIVLVPTVVIPPATTSTVDDSDPIWLLGSNPISLGIPDASENHDKYLSADEFKAIATQLTDEFERFAGSNAPMLSDYAISRAGIYEDHF